MREFKIFKSKTGAIKYVHVRFMSKKIKVNEDQVRTDFTSLARSERGAAPVRNRYVSVWIRVAVGRQAGIT